MALTNKFSTLSAKLVSLRMWIQAAFLLLWLDPLGVRYHGMCSPVFHCYACPLATFACPIGVLANFAALHVVPFVALGLLIAVGALFGTLVCGWACPFGFLQDLAAKIPTPKFDPPRWTGHMRYVVLIGTVLLVPYFFGKDHALFICSFCPAGAIEAAAPNMVQQAAAGQEVIVPNPLKLAVLILFVAALFLVRRPWCRVLCPLGAIFSMFNRASVFFLRLDPDKCTQCDRCHTLCKLGIQPEKSPNDSRCTRCLECTKCGPEALSLRTVFHRNEGASEGTKATESRSPT